MIFSKFEIGNFRCFEDTQTLKLAAPQDGNPGSGITYIVGENNSGKTTVLEGFFFRKDDKIRSSDKRGDGLKFAIYEDESGTEKIARKVSLVRETSYTLGEDQSLPSEAQFEIIQSRRGWKSNAQNSQNQQQIFSSNKYEKPRQDPGFQIASFLKDIESKSSEYNDFIKYVKRVLPDFHSYAIGNDEHEFIEYQTKDGQRHRSDFLGDGVISTLRIVAHLFVEARNPIVIDEPELSLHPGAQKRLLELIAEASQGRQIIIATHSPYMISWEYIANGATLNRVFKENERNSKICNLQDYDKYKVLISGANWQQPFLMDVVAKEVFFNDNVLFVEGQEDVGLLRKAGDLDEDVNLFGYGVRGKDAFKIALQLAKDLGIKKAGVLLDKGGSEDIIKSEIENQFAAEGYKVFQWGREDIRDKEPFQANEKVGYFSKKGQKKCANELGDYQEKIDLINGYFDAGTSASKKLDDIL